LKSVGLLTKDAVVFPAAEATVVAT